MIAILIAFHKRPDVTRVVMRHYQRLADKRGDLYLVAVGSEGEESRKLAEENGWLYVEAPNSPLSDKLSAGLAKCRELKPDGVLCMGSDDLVTETWIDECADLDPRLPQSVIGLLDMYLVRRGTWEAVHWRGYEGRREGETVGAHRFFPASALDALGWKLWPAGLERNLDAGLTARLAENDIEVIGTTMEAAKCAAIGISGVENLTPWELVSHGAEACEFVEATALFPKETVREILALRTGGGEDTIPEYLARRDADPGYVPLVSLVMIARDAAKTILRAIRPALPFVDEIVCVVDSRTTDATIARLAAVDATVVVEEWRGFAWARNRAAECARGRWHLLLDADETIEPGDLREAIEAAEDADADAVTGTVLAHSIPGQLVPMKQVRALRAGRAKFAYVRHNELVGVKTSVDSTLVVRNSYIGRLETIAKVAIPELLAMYESPSETLVTPDEEKAHAAVFLARSYLALRDNENALLWARRCQLHTQPAALTSVMAAICEVWSTLFVQGIDEAETCARAWIERAPGVAEFHYIAGSIQMMKCLLAATAPGRYAMIPQGCLAHVPQFPKAFEMMGFPFEVSFEPGMGEAPLLSSEAMPTEVDTMDPAKA